MFLLCTLMVLAQPKPNPWAAPLEWSDGERTHQVYESPDLVAAAPEVDVATVAPRAEVVSKRGGLMVWQVADARALTRAHAALLPVFHDGRSSEAKRRVALGGVLVVPAGDAHALEVELHAQRIGPDAPYWLVPSAGGLEAFALAKKLKARADVSVAMPRWWYPVVKK